MSYCRQSPQPPRDPEKPGFAGPLRPANRAEERKMWYNKRIVKPKGEETSHGQSDDIQPVSESGTRHRSGLFEPLVAAFLSRQGRAGRHAVEPFRGGAMGSFRLQSAAMAVHDRPHARGPGDVSQLYLRIQPGLVPQGARSRPDAVPTGVRARGETFPTPSTRGQPGAFWRWKPSARDSSPIR